jgi:hypothetical protein
MPLVAELTQTQYKDLISTVVDSEYDYIGTIRDELLKIVSVCSVIGPKDVEVERELERLFENYDWSKSFYSTQVLVYDEAILSEFLPIIHNWLRRKCCDIENIVLISITHPGIADWWKSWCSVNHQKSFQIKEANFWDSPTHRGTWISENFKEPSLDFFKENKKITKLFSFYGGTYSKIPQEFLTLKLMRFCDVSVVDYLGTFNSKDKLLGYAESMYYYKNQFEIDQLSESYDKYVSNNFKLLNHSTNPNNYTNSPLKCKIDFNGTKWNIDRQCFATVVRETMIDDVFSCLSEKTMQAFLHHNVVIPVAFDSVSHIEKLGFWLPHELIDYSYQKNTIFVDRIDQMILMLDRLVSKYSMSDLNDFYIANLNKFQYNSKLMFDYIFNSNERLIK